MLQDPMAAVDNWEETPGSWMGQVVNLAHDLDNGLVQANF